MHPRLALALVLLAAAPAGAAPPRFTATEMMRLQRLSDAQVSPDGRFVAYAAVEVNLPAGTRNSDLWLVPTAGDAAPRRLTTHPKSDARPRWFSDAGAPVQCET